MKTTATKLMVILLSLMMTVSSFITFSFAEDPQDQTQATETTATAVENTPEPEPDPEPVKVSTPEPDPEPVVDNSNQGGGGSTEEDLNGSTGQQEDPTLQNDVNGNGTTPEVVQGGQDGDQNVQEEPKDEEKKEEEDKMPAQSFSGSAGGLNVKASAGQGVFPEGTDMKVSSVSASGVVAAAQSLTGEDSEIVDAAAADITFYNNGSEIQPKGSVKVSLRPTRALEGDTFKMVHVSGGSVDVVAGASAGGASASVSSFSIYGIIGEEYDENTEVKARYTYNFYVGEELVDSQTVINGEKLTAPADPKLDAGKFKGWQIAGQSGMLDFSEAISISDEETEDKEFTVKAVIAETFYATFWKDKNKTDVLETKEGEKDAEIITSDVTWQFPDGKGITGWTLNGTKVTKFNITENVDLIPIISNDVVQVSFATGEGTPIPPVFVEVGTSLTEPDNPTRTGYTFKGWFTDEACSNVYNFSDKVENAFTLYAKWEGQKTTYKVVRWKQNANDDGYTFAEMETKSANAGLNAEYSAKNYQGFTLNSAKSNETVIIKGDGTTIKNVYYDRNTYPLTFYVYEKTGTNWWGGDVYDWVKKDTKNFRYEADTSTYWNQISAKYKDVEWFKGKTSNISYSAAPVMEPPGGGNLNGFAGISVYGQKVEGTSYVYYLDYADRTTKIRPDYVGGRVDWYFTDEDYIQIPGWTFKQEGTVGYEGKGKNRRYVGRLYYTRNNYGVKFIPGNGDASIEKTAAYEAPINNLVPSNYNSESTWNNNGIAKTFAGWYNNEALLGEPVDFSSMKMPALQTGGSLVFYGKWTAEQHSVSFDLNGGTFDGSDSIAAQIVESGKEATAPDSSLMEKEGGYVFGGWVDDAGNRFSFDTQITKDYNLKAVWNSDKTKLLGIKYVAGDGSGTVSDNIMYQDGAYAVIKGQPEAPEDKYFEGWKIGSSDLVLVSGSFQVKSEYAVDNTVTLTAQYADKPAHPTSVTYVLNGGNIGGSTDNIIDKNAVVNGNYIVRPYAPKRDGFTFAGWNNDSNGNGSTFQSGSIVAAGKNGNFLYAQWKKEDIVVKVDIIGNTGTATYDGKEHEVTGYTVKVTKAPKGLKALLFGAKNTEDNLSGAVTVKLKGDKTARAAGTDAGSYMMGLTIKDFVIEANPGYRVTGTPNYEDGGLTIAPKSVTVTANNSSKQFGAADPTFTANVTGLIGEDKIDYTVTRPRAGTDEAVGTYYGAIVPKGSITQGSYTITYVNSDFTISASNDLMLTVTDYKGTYDGRPHGSAAVASVMDGTTIQYSVDGGITWSTEVPKITDVDTIMVDVKATNPDYKEKTASYKLEVTPVTVTVTTGSASKAYDGTPLTDAAASIEGLVNDETATVKATGSQTEAGSSSNTYSISWGTAKEGNYTISENLGTLEVTRKEVTVTANNSSKQFGAADPEFTASVTGLIGEDKIVYTVTRPDAGTDEAVGTYNDAIVAQGEEEQGNYKVTYKPGTFTITSETVDVTVEKEWNDGDNKDNIRPEEVRVVLLVNGDLVPDTMPVALNKDNGWKHTWKELPKFDGTDMIEYTVDEPDVPEGYNAEVSGSVEEGFKVTNTHTPKQDNNEEVVPPVDPDKPEQKGDYVPETSPEKKSDVLGDYEDGSKGAVKTADSGKSTGGGPKTGDSNRMFLYIEILSLAVISLIMLIAGRREEEESE